jgi:peptidoglycan/LPS O-acetylase OafA/YrhL
MVRNGANLGILPRGQRTAILLEMNDNTIKPDKRISHHLSVFNGLKGLCTVLMTWGFTFYFSWFSIVANADEVDDMRNEFAFNFVSIAVYTVPVFFFCSGFLQTFSLMQEAERRKEHDLESIFSTRSLTKYYLLKIFRYMPLNVMVMLFLIFIMPSIGNGPIWDKFDVMMNGCNSNWWANVLWMSNFYPVNFDDKCMPWTWFVPCYV